MTQSSSGKLAIIGLGYVGLPLAVEFGLKRPTVGFDIDSARIKQLSKYIDSTLEVDEASIRAADQLTFTDELTDIAECTIFIVTVPTPIDDNKQPDLTPLRSASKTVGQCLKKGDLVIYESTVYPGATEEVCVPILCEQSGLRFNEHFTVGYSPERINPGDKTHRLTNILKVVAGSTPEAAKVVDDLYSSVITAGTHLASSIQVAEAAKVIENTQRDLNIALINELCLIFHRLGLDTEEVLEAAGTKWNFLPFRPGLVGGHCISVDPYYLTHKAQHIGYHPEVILAGRRINDGMGAYVTERVVKLMTRERIAVVGARVLVLGFAFKENCPDLRNTRVIDIVRELDTYHAQVDIFDPWVDAEEAQDEYGVKTIDSLEDGTYDAIIVAVGHKEFAEMGVEKIRKLGKPHHVLFDVKYVFDKDSVDERL